MKNPAHPPKIAPPIISSIIKSYIKNKLLTNYTLYNVRSVECVRKVCSNPILCNNTFYSNPVVLLFLSFPYINYTSDTSLFLLFLFLVFSFIVMLVLPPYPHITMEKVSRRYACQVYIYRWMSQHLTPFHLAFGSCTLESFKTFLAIKSVELHYFSLLEKIKNSYDRVRHLSQKLSQKFLRTSPYRLDLTNNISIYPFNFNVKSQIMV